MILLVNSECTALNARSISMAWCILRLSGWKCAALLDIEVSVTVVFVFHTAEYNPSSVW